MPGMDAQTGRALDGVAHLRQSITDILTTPIGSRVMRREYGSRLPALIDAPVTPGRLIDLYAATAEALSRWEPRIKLNRVRAASINDSGKTHLTLEGEYRPDGREVVLEEIVL